MHLSENIDDNTIDVINVKNIINVNKRVYSENIVNVCKLKVNVHRALARPLSTPSARTVT